MARVASKKTRNSQPGPTRPSLHTTPSLLHPHALQLPPLCCGIGGIALCSRGTASCSLSIVPLVYTINSAALHHVSSDEMMERCTAYSTVASGASAEALIGTSRCFLATCCSGERAIGAARQAVPLSLRRRAPPRDGEPLLCLVVPCGLLLLGHCNCSMELQWRLAMSIIECVILAGSSFASVFGALAGPRSHRSACHFCKDLAFWSLKTRKKFWAAGACHTGVRSFSIGSMLRLPAGT